MALVLGTNCGFVLAAPSADPASTAENIDTEASAIKDTAPTGALNVIEIGWWCDNATEEANFEVALYTHNVGDNNPEAVIGSISTTNAKGTGSGWKRVTGLNIPITAGTIYWIGLQLDDTATATATNKGTGAGQKWDTKWTETALTDPWGASDGTQEQLVSIYAVYEEAAADSDMNVIGENIY